MSFDPQVLFKIFDSWKGLDVNNEPLLRTKQNNLEIGVLQLNFNLSGNHRLFEQSFNGIEAISVYSFSQMEIWIV